MPPYTSSSTLRQVLLHCLLPAFLLSAVTIPCLAQESPLPAELTFLSKIGKSYRITYEPRTELQIPEGNRGSGWVGKMAIGKHWEFPVIVAGSMTDAAVWAIIKPAFLANGWTAAHGWSAGGIELLLLYQENGVEAWAETDPRGAERACVDIVEIVPTPFKFTLKHPAAITDAVNLAAGEFPWLGPLPGSRFTSGGYEVHSVTGYGF
jgi:hypothetical protein